MSWLYPADAVNPSLKDVVGTEGPKDKVWVESCRRSEYGRENQGMSSILLTWIVLLFISSLPLTFTGLPMNFLALAWSSNL
jgi:hypothetical protein